MLINQRILHCRFYGRMAQQFLNLFDGHSFVDSLIAGDWFASLFPETEAFTSPRNDGGSVCYGDSKNASVDLDRGVLLV